jgi:DNA polymerase III alpha subunit
LEFYAAILMCEGDDKKFKEYRQDAKNHRIAVRPIHVNHSRENFHIHNGEIYFGFQNLKRIGEGVAKRIVEGQQYANFIDFLHKFGTDLTPVRALIALGVFNEGYDRITLRKFHEYFKETLSKHREAHRRYQVSLEEKKDTLRKMLLEEITEDDPDFAVMCEFTPEARTLWAQRFANTSRFVERKVRGETRQKEVSFYDLLVSLAKKYEDSIEKFEGKDRIFRDRPMTLDHFDPSTITLEPEEEPLLVDEIEVQGAKSYPKAEIQYYGFQWIHELETSPDFDGFTIDRLIAEAEKREEEDEEVAAGRKATYANYVEVIIRKAEKKTSKKNKNFEFFSLVVEDSNGRQMYCTVWMDDYLRYQKEMKVGTMCADFTETLNK